MEETAENDVIADTPAEAPPKVEGEEEEFELFLVGKHSVAMSEEPYQPPGEFSIIRERIDLPRDKNRKDPSDGPMRFLLVGFDTEYQSLKPLYTNAEVTKKKTARYEVLSYQFFAKMDDFTTSGIVIPEPRRRISFVDFISYVIAKVTSAGAQIPPTIVLVGHFNKADFPAFDDRDQAFKKLVIIRNSLITLSYPIKIRIGFSDDANDFAEVNVHVRDTILLAPGGQRTLSAIGR
ncbi:hypothetical protein [Bradyrhizobium sp. URHD0069]|uniref:hypothetical protein n=1 Tax=Bradyrhizobium sp. URHD0069 TaxID=1380355 RepID=UPI0004955D8B|nr:hypothetical protein [Bradyrhizobium sp. URHD0069]